MVKQTDPLRTLKDAIHNFAEERDWDQFHSPKNLSMALAVEASELMEIFQWLTEEESRNLPEETLTKVRGEIADVAIYLLRLTDKLDIDLLKTMESKLTENKKKYPVEQVRGSAKKYTEYT